MKPSLLFLAGFSLLMGACKKDSITTSVSTPTPVVETACQCLKENIGVTISNQVPCYGFLNQTNHINQSTGESRSYVSIDVRFYKTPWTYVSGDSLLPVDSVSLNGQMLSPLKDINGHITSYNYSYENWPLNQNWQVNSSNAIPSFSENMGLQNPTADYSQLPSQLSKSLLKSFPINGISNITRASATLFKSGVSGPSISVILKAGDNQVCFPSEFVSRIDTGKATLMIDLENLEIRDIGNKKFGFTKNVQFIKEIQLNP